MTKSYFLLKYTHLTYFASYLKIEIYLLQRVFMLLKERSYVLMEWAPRRNGRCVLTLFWPRSNFFLQRIFFTLQFSIALTNAHETRWAIVTLVLFTNARTTMACYPSNSKSRVVGQPVDSNFLRFARFALNLFCFIHRFYFVYIDWCLSVNADFSFHYLFNTNRFETLRHFASHRSFRSWRG